MTVSVTEDDGRHRAAVDVGGTPVRCCETGHADPLEAARHAWKLTRVLARKTVAAA